LFDVYPYSRFEKYYQFTTAQDVVVTVFILKDKRWFPYNPEITNVYSFSIETSKPSMGIDARLKNTVLEILSNFLKENDAVITFFCDPDDGKGHKRNMKFQRWFRDISDESLEKHDREVIVKYQDVNDDEEIIDIEVLIYSSLLVRREHPNYDAVIRIFQSGDSDKTDKL